LSGAVMVTVAGGGVLPFVGGLFGVVSGEVPPPPLEQAAKPIRQAKDTRRRAPFVAISIEVPQIPVRVQVTENPHTSDMNQP
jgi:hypothetical protein